jgi:hypothetical protein
MEKNVSVPILIPFEPEEFWARIRVIIREEVSRNLQDLPINLFIKLLRCAAFSESQDLPYTIG